MSPPSRAHVLDRATKIRLCSGRTTWSTEPVEALGLRSIVMTDGPHGVRRTTTDAAIIAADPATCFPTAAGLGATWDRDLLVEVGEAIGREAAAHGVSVVLGPGANIKRHPLGGRNFEYLAEDPLLTGELAASLIEGTQRTGVGTSLKHFVANNQESMRMVVDVVVDERALREIYLAGFERAIRRAQPWTVMCAYNRLNGTYCSDDRRLLTSILRDEWGFEGVVVTDWGAANDRVQGIRAGLDLEMPGNEGANDPVIAAALETGELVDSDLDTVVDRLIHLIARGNRAVDGSAADSPGPDDAMFDRHHELACRAAAESAVLLTNDGVLPLDASGTIAVLGGFATEPRFQGAGSSQVTPTRVDTLLDAVRNRVGAAGRIMHAQGYDPVDDVSRDDLIDEAVLVARAAEVAIAIVGLPSTYESEGFDREHLRLPDEHHRLVRAVCDVNPNTVVVLANGAPVQLPWVDRPRAVLDAYLGGQGGGTGLARVLFGDVDPGGRLAETFPLRQDDHGSDAWFPGTGRQVQYRESIHVGYRWFDTVDSPVLFPFGHGMSYTTFEYADLEATTSATSVVVTNTGDRAGTEVVQLYVRRPDSQINRAAQELKAFAKIRLEPRESVTVTLELDDRAFAHWDVRRNRWSVEPGPAQIAVGSSSRDIRLVTTIDVSGDRPEPTASDAGPAAPTSAADLRDDARFAALLEHPIPAPDDVEPFDRNSTLAEVSVTGLGRGLRAGAIKAARRQLGDMDEVTAKFIDRMMGEAPMRSMVLLGGGRLSWVNLDRMIAAMNAARRVSGLRRRVLRRR
ncbi:MAG: glycoside hydrolase family 3 C-terminal domain-containing protein [Actinomycetota bacterium]